METKENATQTNNDTAVTKTFTQDEVNRIVSDRLKREHEKMNEQPSETEQREKELLNRENKMSCKEYIAENGYSSELLDLFNTDNVDEFKENISKLYKICPQINEPIRNPVAEIHQERSNETLADIFNN